MNHGERKKEKKYNYDSPGGQTKHPATLIFATQAHNSLGGFVNCEVTMNPPIEGGTNSRIHHFYQSALHITRVHCATLPDLPECIVLGKNENLEPA